MKKKMFKRSLLAIGMTALLLAGLPGCARGGGDPGTSGTGGAGSATDAAAGGAGGTEAGGGQETAPRGEMVLDEPEYTGLSKYNEKPEFRLTWNRYPEADGYEVAFYAEGEDPSGRGPFAIRSTKSVYDESTPYVDAEFLKGVPTDTVRYRVKVRPTIGPLILEDAAEYVWSNIWEIDFVDGEYTVTASDADFDEEIAAAEEAEKEETPAPAPAAERKDPLPHSFPESLAEYLAREQGEESLPLEEITSLGAAVLYCEYGEAPQTITDAASIRQFVDALETVVVTGEHDEISSTETSIGLSGRDADGSVIVSLSLQAGMLERNDGRYELENAGALYSIDGVMYPEDWAVYWENYNEKKDAYEDAQGSPEGRPLVEAAGYDMHRMSLGAPESISYAYAYVDWIQDAGRFSSTDPQEIAVLWDALSKLTVGRREDNTRGEMWHLNFSFRDTEDGQAPGNAWIEFFGDYVEIGDYRYKVEGIDEFYEAMNSDFFNYVRDFIDLPKIDPSY